MWIGSKASGLLCAATVLIGAAGVRADSITLNTLSVDEPAASPDPLPKLKETSGYGWLSMLDFGFGSQMIAAGSALPSDRGFGGSSAWGGQEAVGGAWMSSGSWMPAGTSLIGGRYANKRLAAGTTNAVASELPMIAPSSAISFQSMGSSSSIAAATFSAAAFAPLGVPASTPLPASAAAGGALLALIAAGRRRRYPHLG